MALELELTSETSLLDALAAVTGCVPAHGRLTLPPHLGRGYLEALELGPGLRLLVHAYELHQEVLVRKAAASQPTGVLVFSFRHLVPLAGPPTGPRGGAPPPTVQVASAGLALAVRAPARVPYLTLLVAADVALLASLLPAPDAPALVQQLLTSRQPFLYEELLTPAMQTVAAQLVAPPPPAALRRLFLRVKTEELLYLLLSELLKRPTMRAYPLRAAELPQVYAVRDHLLADLSQAPRLAALARRAGLSESKLKRLFRQVFGHSVYGYYQSVRLQEAARLLRAQQGTVAQVGNQLGFTNLSHFTRLFTRHFGIRPKRYSQVFEPGEYPEPSRAAGASG